MQARELTTRGLSCVISPSLLGPGRWTVWVAGINDVGAGPEGTFTIDGTTPSSPWLLRQESGIKRHGIDEVELNWDQPAWQGASLVREYRLWWKARGAEWTQTPQATLAADATTYVISGLSPGRYVVRIAAVNDQGSSPAYERPFTVEDWSPSLLPGDDWIDASWQRLASASSYTIEWRPATTTGWDGARRATVAATGDTARIYFKGLAGWDGARRATVAATATKYTIEGLPSGVRYTVRVGAAASGGPPDWSSPCQCDSLIALAPRGLLLQGRHERVFVSWTPPEGLAAEATARYSVQWHRRDQPGSVVGSASVSADKPEVEIRDVENSLHYTVRVLSIGHRAKVLDSAEASVRVDPASENIEREVIELYEHDYPWLRQAWNVPIETTTSDDPHYSGIYRPATVSVKTLSGVRWPRLLEGIQIDFAWSQYQRAPTVIHELAHHFTLDHRAPDNPASVATGWLFLSDLVDDDCALEAYAGLLTHHMLGDAAGQQGNLRDCDKIGYPPPDEAREMVASVSRGEMPRWLYDTYSPDGTAAMLDLDLLWNDIRLYYPSGGWTSPSSVAYGFRDSFGGFCSYREALDALDPSSTARNPWRDGGCKNRRPQDLTASASEHGEIDVTWEAPLYRTSPDINAYAVQWKTAVQSYDSSRQTVVNVARNYYGETTHKISGLDSGTEYTIRVAAVNSGETSNFFNNDGHGRTAETTATAS